MQPEIRIEALLDEVIKRKASDLHLQVGVAPMLRVDGSLVSATGAPALTEESVEALIFAIIDEEQKLNARKKEIEATVWAALKSVTTLSRLVEV